MFKNKDLLQQLLFKAAGIFACLTMLFTTGYGQKKFVVTGNLAKYQKGIVRLTYYDLGQKIVDSVNFKDGGFEFSGTIASPTEATIVINPLHGRISQDQYLGQDMRTFYLDKHTLIKSDSGLKTATIIAGLQQRHYDESLVSNLIMAKQMTSLNDLANHYMSEKNVRGMDTLRKQAAVIRKQKNERDSLFIFKHPKSYAAFQILFWAERAETFSLQTAEVLYNRFSKEIRNSYSGKQLMERIRVGKSLEVGKSAFDFSLPDTSGKPVLLSSLRGKYVLLCFLSKPANKILTEIYQQAGNENIVIFAVSFSERHENWKNEVFTSASKWINVLDDNDHKDTFSGLVSRSSSAYNLTPINLDQCLLLDPMGNVLMGTTKINQNLPSKIASEFTKNR